MNEKLVGDSVAQAVPTPEGDYVKRMCKALREEPYPGISHNKKAADLIEALYLAALPLLTFRASLVSSTVSAPPAPQADVRAALEKLIAAARQMPRQTPGPGGAATGHHYVLTAGAVWGLDRAINEAVAALTGAVAGTERGTP